jgi:hypothetical protein
MSTIDFLWWCALCDNQRTNERMNEWMNEWMNEQIKQSGVIAKWIVYFALLYFELQTMTYPNPSWHRILDRIHRHQDHTSYCLIVNNKRCNNKEKQLRNYGHNYDYSMIHLYCNYDYVTIKMLAIRRATAVFVWATTTFAACRSNRILKCSSSRATGFSLIHQKVPGP